MERQDASFALESQDASFALLLDDLEQRVCEMEADLKIESDSNCLANDATAKIFSGAGSCKYALFGLFTIEPFLLQTKIEAKPARMMKDVAKWMK
jgi:4-diphosphocytidyl-2C-methyl-D-erythritol kinase